MTLSDSAQARRHCPHYYGVGNMKTERTKQTEEEVDAFVVAQAEDENAWDQPVRVVKKKSASVSIPFNGAIN